MDHACVEVSRSPERGVHYACISPITPAQTPRNCHASFNLPRGSTLREIDHLHAFLSNAPGEVALSSVRVWALKVGQGNIGHGEAFFLSWTLGDYRVSKDKDFRPCSGTKGPLVLKANIYITPP